jgi:hypothetical protein
MDDKNRVWYKEFQHYRIELWKNWIFHIHDGVASLGFIEIIKLD